MGAPDLNDMRAFLAALRAMDPATLDTGLSPAGAREAWKVALDAVDAALPDLVALPGHPWDTAELVSARGAFTAPIEWITALLAQGTRVRWKIPSGPRGSADAILAAAAGLPLVVHTDRDLHGDVVIAMGSDEGVDAIRASLPRTTPFVGFGHRFSAAWIADPSSWEGLASDLALHDSRGCLTPVAAFTPLDPEASGESLARAMAAAEARWPRGDVADAEHARIRARRALAKATGRVWEGDGWSVLLLPIERFEPVALPRVAVVHAAPTSDDARTALARWGRWLSTVGADDGSRFGPYVRHCRPGEMQRPEVDRLHDGIRWLDWVVRPGGAQPA